MKRGARPKLRRSAAGGKRVAQRKTRISARRPHKAVQVAAIALTRKVMGQARGALMPCEQAAVTAAKFNVFHDSRAHADLDPALDRMALAAALGEQIGKVRAGDMSRPEAMLVAQAHTLDAMFNSLAQQSRGCLLMPQFETVMRLAFKAQSQCRTTLETLAEIRHPRPVAFVHQANIANGPQQVNNARAENLPNELEGSNGARMVTAAPMPASIPHSPREAVETLDGAAHAGGQAASGEERVQGRDSADAPVDR